MLLIALWVAALVLMPNVAIAEFADGNYELDGIGCGEETKLIINKGNHKFTKSLSKIFGGRSTAKISYSGSSSHTYAASSSSGSPPHNVDNEDIEAVEKEFQSLKLGESGFSDDYSKADQHLMGLVTSREYQIGHHNEFASTDKPQGLENFSISHVVPGDGNCQFRAVALLFWRDEREEDDHQILRREAVKYMRDNPESFPLGEARERYLEDMAEDRTWGDHFTLTALAAHYNRRFVVVKQTGWGVSYTHVYRESQGANNPSKSKQIIHFLSLRGKHYEILVPEFAV